MYRYRLTLFSSIVYRFRLTQKLNIIFDLRFIKEKEIVICCYRKEQYVLHRTMSAKINNVLATNSMTISGFPLLAMRSDHCNYVCINSCDYQVPLHIARSSDFLTQKSSDSCDAIPATKRANFAHRMQLKLLRSSQAKRSGFYDSYRKQTKL